MDKVIVNIGNKTYNCQVAKTEEERRKGLMNVEYLPPDEGMLFIFDKESTQEFWMKNTPLELSKGVYAFQSSKITSLSSSSSGGTSSTTGSRPKS